MHEFCYRGAGYQLGAWELIFPLACLQHGLRCSVEQEMIARTFKGACCNCATCKAKHRLLSSPVASSTWSTCMQAGKVAPFNPPCCAVPISSSECNVLDKDEDEALALQDCMRCGFVLHLFISTHTNSFVHSFIWSPLPVMCLCSVCTRVPWVRPADPTLPLERAPLGYAVRTMSF